MFPAYGNSESGVRIIGNLTEFVWFLSKLDKNSFLCRNEQGHTRSARSFRLPPIFSVTGHPSEL